MHSIGPKSQRTTRIVAAALLLVLFSVASSSAQAARIAILEFSTNSIWLEDPSARNALVRTLKDLGHEVSDVRDVSQFAAFLDPQKTDLVLYAPCEAIPDQAASAFKAYLRNGGKIVTGGGMPAWYRISQGKPVAQGDSFQRDMLGTSGLFISEHSLELTDLGKKLLGDLASLPSGNRAIRAGDDMTSLILATANKCPLVVIYRHNGDGRLMYTGSHALQNSVLNPLALGAKGRWEKVLKFLLDSPMPDMKAEMLKRTWIIGRDKTVPVKFELSNPSKKQPMNVAGEFLLIRNDVKNGKIEKPVVLKDFKIKLKPAQKGAVLSYDFAMPAPQAWGFYKLQLRTSLGQTTDSVFHVLPPCAVSFIDVDPLYPDDPDTQRDITVGIRSIASKSNFRLVVETAEDVEGPWQTVMDKAVQIRQTATSNIDQFTLKVKPQGKDLIVRAKLMSDDTEVHHAWNRIEVAKHRRALDRPDTMFRAIDGWQFEKERDEWVKTLTEWPKKYSLFRGLQPFSTNPEMHAWAKKHGFTVNTGTMLANWPEAPEWRFDDCDVRGVSAYKMMPGHCEDLSLWIVQQHSRAFFDRLVPCQSPIVNLVEAVTGYNPGQRLVGGWFGYTSEATVAYREALRGKDEGIRLQDLGGKQMKRYHLVDLYQLVYDEPLPTAKELGFKSYGEFKPINTTLGHEAGRFYSRREMLRVRLHYFLRAYLHIRRLDEISCHVRVTTPEMHFVIGHDGPLVGQITSIIYRLPYMDTHTRWLFRSAFVQAWNVTNGIERTWPLMGERFGKRIGAHEEIGGGQYSPYRTAETSFVSLFTKRAALPWRDLQVDFYTSKDRTARIAEEEAIYRGFQLAVDTDAKSVSDNADILVVTNNGAHYPSTYQGFFRWDIKTPEDRILSIGDCLARNGIQYHSWYTPLLGDLDSLQDYKTVFLVAARQMRGDLETLNKWIRQPGSKGRRLVLNHAAALQLDYTKGPKAWQMTWNDATRWKRLGLNLGKPRRGKSSKIVGPGGQELAFVEPITTVIVRVPRGAQVLWKDNKGKPVVWEQKVGDNWIVYSGLPLNNLTLSEDTNANSYRALLSLLSSWGYERDSSVKPEGWFAGRYHLSDNRLAVAIIRPEETKLAMGHYDRDDGVAKAAAKLGAVSATVSWRKAGMPGTVYAVTDAWTGEVLPQKVTVDTDGTIKLKVNVDVAKLYILTPDQ